MAENEKKGNSEKKAVGEDGVAEKRPGVLAGQEILELGLVDPIGKEEGEKCLKAASCDLRLGRHIFLCGKGRPILKEYEDGDFVTIKSFGRIIFTTKEIIQLDKDNKDIVGRPELMIRHGLNGLILQVGTQVEPGYSGPLFGLLINTQGEDKSLIVGSKLLTIEFSRMSKPPGELVKPKKVEDFQQFLKMQGVDYDLLSKPSVIDNVKRSLEDCKIWHGLKARIDDSNTFRKTVRWTKWCAIIALTALILSLFANIAVSILRDEIRSRLGLGQSSKQSGIIKSSSAKHLQEKENKKSEINKGRPPAPISLETPAEGNKISP